MKKLLNSYQFKLAIFFLIFILCLPSLAGAEAVPFAQKLAGKILLQVENHGEAWYVNPATLQKSYMKDGAAAYTLMKYYSLGISNSNLNKIPTVTSINEMKESPSVCSSNQLANRLKGKILLQVENHGEAYYVYPDKCRAIYMKDGDTAYQMMRFLGLGITNNDLNKIQTAETNEPEKTILPTIPQTVSTVSNETFSFTYENSTDNSNTKSIHVAACIIPWKNNIDRSFIEELNIYFQKANEILKENSLEKVQFGKLTIAVPANKPESLPGLFDEEEQAALTLCDPMIDFSDVDVFLITPSVVAGRGGASISSMPPLITKEKAIDSRILIGHYDKIAGTIINHLTHDEFGLNLIIHELGHTKVMGYLPHDNSLECGEKSLIIPYSDCTKVVYGNRFSSLSDNLGHFSASLKYQAGWITKNDVIEDGSYELAALEAPSYQPQLLRVKTDKVNLCVEYRKPLGEDWRFRSSEMTKMGLPGGIPNDGCLLITVCDDGLEPLLIDTTPNSQKDSPYSDYYDSKDACLPQGRVFRLDNIGLSISFNSIIRENISIVEVDFH